MPIEDMRNFLVVTGSLASGGRPSEHDVMELSSAGFKVIVNLGVEDSRSSLDEGGLTKRLGMTYYHIPVDFRAPILMDLKTFFGVIDATHDKKTFVQLRGELSRLSVYRPLRAGQAWMVGREGRRAHSEIVGSEREVEELHRAGALDLGECSRRLPLSSPIARPPETTTPTLQILESTRRVA